jgi:hypothetical protein
VLDLITFLANLSAVAFLLLGGVLSSAGVASAGVRKGDRKSDD